MISSNDASRKEEDYSMTIRHALDVTLGRAIDRVVGSYSYYYMPSIVVRETVSNNVARGVARAVGISVRDTIANIVEKGQKTKIHS
jgi:hypothetical protein